MTILNIGVLAVAIAWPWDNDAERVAANLTNSPTPTVEQDSAATPTPTGVPTKAAQVLGTSETAQPASTPSPTEPPPSGRSPRLGGIHVSYGRAAAKRPAVVH
jgi:hypothetical protein